MAIAHAPAPRWPASAVPAIKRLRISPPGFTATLVNVSETGLLAEWGLRLKIGQQVTVHFDGPFARQSVEAQVVRSSVAFMTSAGVRYHVGLAFASPIAFERKAPAAVAGATPPADEIENRW